MNVSSKAPWTNFPSQSINSVLNVIRQPNAVKLTLSNPTQIKGLERSPNELILTQGDRGGLQQSQPPIHSGYRSSESAPRSFKSTDDVWIGDTGATSHMTDKLNLFEHDPRPKESGKRRVNVGGRQLAILGRGTALFGQAQTRLRNVLYVPRLGVNFSVYF